MAYAAETPSWTRTRIVPGDDLANNTNRFVASICKRLFRGLYRLTLYLIGPARKVAEACEDARDVNGLRKVRCLPVVESLYGRDCIRIVFDQLREFVDECAAYRAACLQAPRRGKGMLRNLHSDIYVLGGSFTDPGDQLPCTGIQDAGLYVRMLWFCTRL